ncbi:uncharacterized protein LOC110191366 isoform X2 [Drosophila serrata]|uniref:uncharacterized protein LOC110191366 isoform X2 n=1 Tax=Drosophila serrata TaxID=7274 RepID=UPI000A1D2D2E|nr:uncharacterized protein LOC110191366 isoform X2 [Drosophila serrata]
MKKALKLNNYALLYQPHLTQAFFTSRLKSDSSKSADPTKKETECKLNKDAGAGKPDKDAAVGKPAKDAVANKLTKDAAPIKSAKDATKDATKAAKVPTKSGKEDPTKAAKDPTKSAKEDPSKSAKGDEPQKEAPPPKDETVISGGTDCNPKTPCVPPPSGSNKSKAQKANCESILYKQLGPTKTSKKKVPLTKIQGGALDCQGKKEKKPPQAHHASRFQKYSLYLALPLIAILTLLIFGHRSEEDRLEFKNYDYMYKRDKKFSFGDGNRSAFHNSYYNALPPDGYEDEIDEEGLGQEPETEKDKKSRLKEFEKVFKKWKKHDGKREAQLQKQMAATH